jgi:chromosomal replication initiation ATPase DnaA
MSPATPRQLVFDLPHEAALRREDLIVGAANADAVALVDAWPAWPSHTALLVGPPGSGKTHLLRAFAERSGATLVDVAALGGLDVLALASAGPVAIDDADQPARDETALFHLLNAARVAGTGVLIAAGTPPENWARLPDLLSRLRAGFATAIGEPDDALLRALIVKLLADRQLVAEAATLDYVLPRMERSLAAANRLVERIDRLSLENARPLTRALAADALAGMADEA